MLTIIKWTFKAIKSIFMFVLDMFASYDPKEEVEDEYITQFENQIDVETGEVIPVVIPKKHN
jgi:hypothetical protein